MAQEIKQDFSEMKKDISAVVVQLDRSREKFKDEMATLRQQCEGNNEVVQNRVEEVREEVVAAQSPVSDLQLCGVTGHYELRVSVANMEEPCFLDSLFGNAACEGAAKQVESPVTSLDVEERLELNCGVVREHEAADATEEGHEAVSSCGDDVNGGAGKVGPVESRWSKAG